MIDTFSKIPMFLLGVTVLLFLGGCQLQSNSESEQLPATITAKPAPQATPSPTPAQRPGTASTDVRSRASSYELVAEFANGESEKLSDIVFYPPRETLFAVRDNGQIIEIKTDGSFIRDREIREGADLEGITYNPDTGMLYVVVEGEEIIFEINPDSLVIAQISLIDRSFEGRLLLSPDGDGVEGIAYVPATPKTAKGSFYLVNQADKLTGDDASIVVEVELKPDVSHPRAEIVRYFSVGVTDLSGITYVPSYDSLLITSDTHNLLLETSLDGEILNTYPLPGENQEGITVDGDGSLYIAQDTNKPPLKLKLLSGTTPNGP
jgi:hypothetical protein